MVNSFSISFQEKRKAVKMFTLGIGSGLIAFVVFEIIMIAVVIMAINKLGLEETA